MRCLQAMNLCLCREQNKSPALYHRNQQYSITAMTDGSGAVTERYAYSAYGTPTITNASGTARTATAIENRYTYTGREYDEGLDLYHYRARLYDSASCRFCSRDPIGFDGSRWNLFEFLLGNPIKYVDPSGLEVDINLFPETDPLCNLAEQHPDSSGTIIIGAHGCQDGTIFGPDNEIITTVELIDKIKSCKDYQPGVTIVIKSCFPAKSPSRCQWIADKTGLPVVASPRKCSYIYYKLPKDAYWWQKPKFKETETYGPDGKPEPPLVFQPEEPLRSSPFK